MARQAREKSKSGNYYIVLRGQKLYTTDADKARFTEIANEKFSGGKIYGIEISDNEIRMAVKEPENGISMAMKSLTTVYARYYNNVTGREGKLFEGRFKSEPLETKKEVDECVANLKNETPAPKRASVKKTASPAQKKSAVKEKPAPKPEPKKNLPSWLL